MTMDRFSILRRFQGVLRGTIRVGPESSIAELHWSYWSVRSYRGLYESGRSGYGRGSCHS